MRAGSKAPGIANFKCETAVVNGVRIRQPIRCRFRLSHSGAKRLSGPLFRRWWHWSPILSKAIRFPIAGISSPSSGRKWSSFTSGS